MNDVHLTKRQHEVFNFMCRFYEDNDQLPPMHVVAKHFGFKSTNSAQEHADALERKQLIQKNTVGKYMFVRTGPVATVAVPGLRLLP